MKLIPLSPRWLSPVATGVHRALLMCDIFSTRQIQLMGSRSFIYPFCNQILYLFIEWVSARCRFSLLSPPSTICVWLTRKDEPQKCHLPAITLLVSDSQIMSAETNNELSKVSHAAAPDRRRRRGASCHANPRRHPGGVSSRLRLINLIICALWQNSTAPEPSTHTR